MPDLPQNPAVSRRSLLKGSAAAAGLALGGLVKAPAVHAQALLPIKFSLNAPADGSNAAFFHALEKGYFREAGLAPTLDPSQGAGDSIQRVASETYDSAFSDLTVLVEFNAKNPAQAPVGVFNIYNRSPTCIIAWKSAGISKPADLAGKTLGAPQTDGAFRLFPAFVKATGIDASRVKMQTVDLRLREAVMLRREVDGVFGFDSTIYFNLKSNGVKLEDLTFLYYSDHGLDFYSNTIIVSKKFMRENAAKVPGLVKAIARGWIDAARQPAVAIQALAKREPLIKPELETERLEWIIKNQIRSADSLEDGMGVVRPARLARAIDQVAEAFQLATRPTLESMFDPQFLPAKADRVFA